MKTFKVNIIIYTEAMDELNVERWVDDFLVPDLNARWSDGSMHIETEIEEV